MQPTFFIPNKLNLDAILLIEEELRQECMICWMLEENTPIPQDIFAHLSQQRAPGFYFNLNKHSPQHISQQIEQHLKQNQHVILLPTRDQAHKHSQAIAPEILEMLQQLGQKITPLHHYQTRDGKPHVHLLATISPSPASSAQLLSAWSEGQAIALERSQSLQEIQLAPILINSLQANSNASITCGVENKSITYQQLLEQSLLIAKYLKDNYTNSQRIGILLPPSPSAISANIACILAGKSPVNIDFKQENDTCQQLAKTCHVTRFITEASTQMRLKRQAWVNDKDIIILSKILKQQQQKPLQFAKLRTQYNKAEKLLNWLNYRAPKTDDEALILFSKGQQDALPKPREISHKQVLAQLLQLEQLSWIQQSQSTLSRHPYNQGIGLFLGILLPIINGHNIVTYPLVSELSQAIRLCQDHQIQLISCNPEQLQQIIHHQEWHPKLASLKQIVCSGAPLTQELSQQYQQHLTIPIHNAYFLTEAGAFVSISRNLHQQASETSSQHAPVGTPLPGTAYRIGNPHIKQRNIPIGQKGGLWIKGPSISTHTTNHWFETGDIGSINHQGQLTIHGRRQRFSRIGKQLISHEQLENHLYKHFQLDPKQGRQLAIISINDKQNEKLVLLTSAHKTFSANDYITLRYGLTNQKYPSSWCPDKVLTISKIPLLSNGLLDYEQCCQLSIQALQVKPQP